MQTFSEYADAELEADMLTGDTGAPHLVVERFEGEEAGPVPGVPARLVGVMAAPDRGTLFVMTVEEWEAVKDHWDAEVQYDATRGTG